MAADPNSKAVASDATPNTMHASMVGPPKPPATILHQRQSGREHLGKPHGGVIRHWTAKPPGLGHYRRLCLRPPYGCRLFDTLQGQLQTGKLRALATTARRRAAPLPDVPTVAEFGYKDFAVEFFGGVVAPARTPGKVISQLIGWFSAAMQSSQIEEANFGAILRKQYEDYGRIIRDVSFKRE